jgi:hypothetical protein
MQRSWGAAEHKSPLMSFPNPSLRILATPLFSNYNFHMNRSWRQKISQHSFVLTG